MKKQYFLSFIFGALSAFAFAPFNFFVAFVISISAFYFLLEKNSQDSKKSFLLGFFYGFGYFLSGIYWIAISLLVDAQNFAWLIPFALTFIPGALAVYIAFFALAYQKICKKFEIKITYLKILLFVNLWVIFEILRSYLFTGFPWNLSGYSLMFSDYSSQSSCIFGVFGLSFLAILFCLAPVAFFDKSKSAKIFLSLIIAIFVANFSFGFLRINGTELKNKDYEIRLVQGNIKQEMKWDSRVKYNNFLKHIAISKSVENENLKAIIWSETAVPYAFGGDENLIKKTREAILNDGFLVTGAIRVDFSEDKSEVRGVYNSVFAIDENSVKHYDKHHLVPFGEYIPLAKYLPFLQKITNGGGSFSRGNGPRTLEMKGLKFSPLICYEAIFSDKIIDRKNRPELLINSTNDAWFGKSSGPYQHLNMTRMRAIEYGISLARVANTGVSAYVDPFGRIVAKINLDEEGFVDATVIEPLSETIYSQFKYFGVLLLMLISSLAIVIGKYKTP